VVLGCRCGVELVVCVSVVRVCVCFWVVVWFFGAVFEWAFGCQRACGVCSRLLEMADVRGNPLWLPPARRVAQVENLTHRHLPIAEPELIISLLLQVP